MLNSKLSRIIIAVALIGSCASSAIAQLRITTPNIINVDGATQVTLGGQTFVNAGLVGMGRIAAGTRDFNNDTLGAFSSMDILLGTWRRTATGYSGSLYGLPDRGPNGRRIPLGRA